MYRVPTTCACLTHWCYNTCVYILVSIPYLPGVLSITQTEHSTYITIPILIEKNGCLYTSAWWLAWTQYSHQCSHPTPYMIFNTRKIMIVSLILAVDISTWSRIFLCVYTLFGPDESCHLEILAKPCCGPKSQGPKQAVERNVQGVILHTYI